MDMAEFDRFGSRPNGTLLLSSNLQKALQASSLVIIFIGAVIFNTFTVLVILRVRHLRRNPYNLLVLNLSVADLGVALASMTFSLVSIFDGGHFLKTHVWACKMNGFLLFMFSFVNLPLIVSIGLDRLLVVVFSHRFSPNRWRVRLFVATSWLVGLAIAIIGGVIGYKYEPTTKHCTVVWENAVFRIGCSVVYLGVTVPVLVVIYTVIACHIWKEGVRLRSQDLQKSGSLSDLRSVSTTTGLPSTADSVKSPSSTSCCCLAFLVKRRDVDTVRPGEQSTSSDGNGRIRVGPQQLQDEDVPASQGDAATMTLSENTHSPIGTTLHQKTQRKRRLHRHKAHRRVIVTGALLVLTTLVCWTSYLLFHGGFVPLQVGHWFWVFTMWLGYCNALLDPLVYAFLNSLVVREISRVRRGMGRLCCACAAIR